MPLAVRASCLAAGVVSYSARSVDWTCASKLCAPTEEGARSAPRRANASAARAKACHVSSRRACFPALFASRFLMGESARGGETRRPLLPDRGRTLAHIAVHESEHLQRDRLIEDRSRHAQPVVERALGPS